LAFNNLNFLLPLQFNQVIHNLSLKVHICKPNVMWISSTASKLPKLNLRWWPSPSWIYFPFCTELCSIAAEVYRKSMFMKTLIHAKTDKHLYEFS